MASGKLSPRQKMINMMYLVLIALLALNISNEILKAFHLMEISFVKANSSLTDKNNGIMKAFEAAEADAAKALRAKPWADKARKVQQISAQFCKDLDVYKSDIEKAAGGRTELEKGQTGLPEMSKGDDMEGHKNYLGTDETAKGKGDALRVLIDKTRQDLIGVLSGIKDDKAVMKGLDNTTAFKVEDFKDDNGNKKTWERDVLGHSPVAGVMAMLTKVQNDCKALETDVLTKLAENIDASTVKFTDVAALIISESNYVMEGENYKADVALMAYNRNTNPKITVNGASVPVEAGMGKISLRASGTGDHPIKAIIEVDGPNGKEFKEISSLYTSFKPSATISADAMNVLYIGLDNPISISVPGVTPENTFPSASGVALTKVGSGKYMAKVAAGIRTATISVTAKMQDGTSKKMGEQIYRIKNVPKPEARVGGLTSGPQSKSAIALQPTVLAVLENFVFENIRYTITKYRVIYAPRRGQVEETTVSGNSAAAISNFARKAKTGDLIVIEGIKANGPGGEKPLNPITFTIQ